MNWNFKLRIVVSICGLVATQALWADRPEIDIVPQPQTVEARPGNFLLRAETKIVANSGAEETGQYLAGELKRRHAEEYPVATGTTVPRAGCIQLILDSEVAGKENYVLTVDRDGVVIEAHSTAGLFYGVQSLLQLLPAGASAGAGTNSAIPCVNITDEPRFQWRGMMLDVSRHFFTKAEVEQLLEEMAWHKLNMFHWHLVDDQGWRIEIKKYPRLTEVGAWRKGVGFGLDPKKTTAYGPDGRYGGFYTQDDVREVVAYAAARHITIVPEIEMPGHSSAALMAYPQFSCTGGPFSTDLPGGVFNGVYCVGNDASFGFVEDVLTEVFEMFPGPFVHIGGDEVPTDNWKACAKCQARMHEEGLTKESDLEGYFIRRVEKFINGHNRRLVGWSEIRNGGLAANATVMDWVGGAVEAATAGHDVVMSPLADCYFDHYQSLDQSKEPKSIGGFLPLRQVYDFEPMPTKLPAEYQSHILGAQANLWTEYIPSFAQVQYMAFPRLCALAEVDWSPKESRNWVDFSRRVKVDCLRLDELGVNHRTLSTIDEPSERPQK